ncbi:MAG: hypothetical protein AB9860_02520 [Methanomassiliicoccales archaeon]
MNIDLPALTRKQWKSMFLVAALATIFRIMLQPLIPAGEGQVAPSVIVEAGLLIPAFTVYAFISYFVMCYAFVVLDARLPGNRMRKGLLFGAALGAIWIVYLFEPVPLGEGTPFLDSLAYPIADGLSVLVLGILLGRFVATDSSEVTKASERKWSALLVFPILLLVVRLFEYNVLDIYSSYSERTVDTIVWVLVTGFIIGAAYLAMRPGAPSKIPSGRSLTFALLFYGLPIVMVNFFVILALDIDVADMVLRSIMDVLAVGIAAYLVERFA